ncbi:MAG: hypothetical protein ABS910_05785 [Arthrobacter sp.]
MTICTTTDCGNETSTYLCGQCVNDLQLWLDKVTETRQMLFTTMAKLDNTGPKNSEGGGGGSTGSAMPLREGAMDLRYALAMWEGLNAAELARDEHAHGFLAMIRELIQDAEKLVDLPPETIAYGPCQTPGCPAQLTGPPDAHTSTCPTCEAVHDVKEHRAQLLRKAHGEPKTPREAREYIQRETGLEVSKKDFENWVQRGHLTHVEERDMADGKRHKLYLPGDVFKAAKQVRDKLIKV